MGYYIIPSQLLAMFPVPAAVADEHLKLASENQLRVIIYIMRHQSEPINAQNIAAALGTDTEEVQDSLLFWEQCGILGSDTAAAEPVKEIKPVLIKTEKPSRNDVARRGNEDERVRMLLNEAQLKFGRPLKDNEARVLLWIYEDLGLDAPVILMLLQYAVSKQKCNIRFIEKTASAWLDAGVETVADAEQCIENETRRELAWSVVQAAFGMERRKPSAKELTYANLWVNEWKFSPEILQAAYEECVNKTSGFSVPYIAKILENWHKSGVKSACDIKKESSGEKPQKNGNRKHSYAGYDIEDVEKLLNS